MLTTHQWRAGLYVDDNLVFDSGVLDEGESATLPEWKGSRETLVLKGSWPTMVVELQPGDMVADGWTRRTYVETGSDGIRMVRSFPHAGVA